MLETWEAAAMILKEYGLEATCMIQWFVIWRLWARNNNREDERREDDRAQIKMLEGFRASVDTLVNVVERLANREQPKIENQGD